MTTPTSDPLSTLAAELGRIGRRLDGMGVELLALRESGAAGSPSPHAGPPFSAPTGQAPTGQAPTGQAPTGQAPTGYTPAGQAPTGYTPAGQGPTWHTPAGQVPPGAGVPAGAPPYGVAAIRVPPPAMIAPVVGPAAAAGQAWAPAGWAPHTGSLGRPAPGGPPPGGWGAPAPTPVPPAPVPPARRRSALTGARLLAWTGGAVTLLGVVLLLALAASRGWFTPPARTAFGALLGAALVGLGGWLHRRETARSGAFAIVATGFATLYLVDAAATAIYDYLPAVLGLVVALLLAGAGLGLADRWRSELLAGGVVVGAAVLAPYLAGGWLLAALALALQVAAVPVVLRRGWAVLVLVAAAGPVLYGMDAVATEDAGSPRVLVVGGVAAAVLAVALGTATLALRPSPVPGTPRSAPQPGDPAAVPPEQRRDAADPANPAKGRIAAGVIAAIVAASVLPALLGAAVLGGWRGALVAAGAAAVLAGTALLPSTVRAVEVAAGTAAAVALLTATVVGLDGSAAALAVLGEALVAAVLAIGLRSRFAIITALVLGALGTLAAVGRDAPLTTLLQFTVAPAPVELVTAVAVATLVLALAAALLVAGGRLGWVRPDASRAPVWVPIGLVGLYGATGAVVDAALLISPTSSGFTVGHAVVTVSWTVAALVLLARGVRHPALRITGLVLVAAAVVKLVLFDLVALDGLARVAAFLGAGLVLLAAGTRYARLVAEAEGAPPSG